MNIDKVNIGDKFSTENKLLSALGYDSVSGNTRIALLKDAQCYFDYTKTGKISRGKETSEIIITNKYIQPKTKQDGRTSDVIKYIKPMLLSMDNKSIGSKRLFLDEFKVVDERIWKKFKGDNRMEFYKYYLLNDFKGKVKTSLKQLYKEYDWFYYSYDYLLINKTDNICEIADKTQSEYIDAMKENIKDRIVARYKLENPMGESKTWKSLSYRYTTTLYKMVNDECKDAFNIDKCVDVITINKSNTKDDNIYDTTTELIELRRYYKIKMADWLKKNYSADSYELLNFHNEIFKDVK